MRGEILCAIGKSGDVVGEIDARQCRRFATVDTAGTSKQKAAQRRGKPPSWSVCQVWDYWPKTGFLFLRHVWRDQVNWDGLKAGVRGTLHDWRPQRTLIENAHHGPPLAAELRGEFQIQLVNPVTRAMRGQSGMPGKVERATPLLNKLERGEVFLPRHNNHWLPDLEAEWLAWTGLEEETADQIDAAAYAADDVGGLGSNCTMTVDDLRLYTEPIMAYPFNNGGLLNH